MSINLNAIAIKKSSVMIYVTFLSLCLLIKRRYFPDLGSNNSSEINKLREMKVISRLRSKMFNGKYIFCHHDFLININPENRKPIPKIR